MTKNNLRYYKEEIEIDETYEKITVPDFSGGKKSRFIHDFIYVSTDKSTNNFFSCLKQIFLTSCRV